LAAAGADLDKVNIILWSTGKKIEGKEPKKRQRMLQLNKDTKVLKAALKENPNIALVIVDPLTSYFGADSNKDSEIRPIMDALSATCRQSKIAFVGIMHYGKDSSRAALQRILGASSIVGSARAVWTFGRNPDDKKELLMSCAKNNLSKNHRGMKFTIEDKMLMFPDGKEGPMGYVEWLGETEEDADEVMNNEREQAKHPTNKKLEDAKLLIINELALGEQRAPDMFRLGEARKISTETMRDAYRSLGVRPYQKGGGWWWALPGMEKKEPPYAKQGKGRETNMGNMDAL
jgi:putative DNA primase/helicase